IQKDASRLLAFQVDKGKLVCCEGAAPAGHGCACGWRGFATRTWRICAGITVFAGPPGHEFVGKVAEVEGVSASGRKRWTGRRACGVIKVSCSGYAFRPVCESCRRGMKRHCARRTG